MKLLNSQLTCIRLRSRIWQQQLTVDTKRWLGRTCSALRGVCMCVYVLHRWSLELICIYLRIPKNDDDDDTDNNDNDATTWLKRRRWLRRRWNAAAARGGKAANKKRKRKQQEHTQAFYEMSMSAAQQENDDGDADNGNCAAAVDIDAGFRRKTTMN